MIGKIFFPEGWICNPHTPVQSKHTFSFSLSSGPRLPKRRQKVPKMEPLGIPNHKKNRKTNTQKNIKNGCKQYQQMTSKRTSFSWRRGLQNHKNPSLGSKYAPSLQKRFPGTQNIQKSSKKSPRASKIAQNHENLVTQNQENPRKKTSRNGTGNPSIKKN